MALEIHATGPGLDATRVVHPGATELILGRDVACDVNLPDPERNVSRRHLAIWNDGGELHFRVLSSLNGVEMPFGYAPPGAIGVLPSGQVLKIGDYSLEVRSAADHDPWAVFDRGRAATDATLPRAALMTQHPEAAAAAQEEDPFGDWGFESTFSGDGGVDAVAKGPGTGDLASFYKGLGLDATKMAGLNPTELEAAGKAIRVALDGLFALYASRSGEPPPAAGAVAPVKDNNPLKTHWPEQAKVQYLFGGRAASLGFVSPQRALTDLVSELLAHDAAVTAATRVAIEATLREFAPAALKERLLGSGSRLFEGSRAWEAYSRYYADKSQGLPAWVQQLLDKYFTEAYLRESKRIKRETGLPPE